jgi:signal transduction histidine kinase
VSVHHAHQDALCVSVSSLENDFVSGAFTSSHIMLLQLLCGQAALSIDNARLYGELSAQNANLEQRTNELQERNAQLERLTEAAESSSKVKADFLASMSHEIRTPMNAVLGGGRLLAETQLNLEQQSLVQMMTNSGSLLLTIINDILDFSKMEAGQLELHRSPHNLSEVVESALEMIHEAAAKKALALVWFVDPAMPPTVSCLRSNVIVVRSLHFVFVLSSAVCCDCDRFLQLLVDATRFQQILLNLLSNATKFTRVGTVWVNVTCSLATDIAPGTKSLYRVTYTVSDTGIGLSEEQQTLLFQSFQQIKHNSGEFSGTGLGLVISRRLAHRMGGDISVKSELGVGSTFTGTLLAELPSSTFVSPASTPIGRSPARRMASGRMDSPRSRTSLPPVPVDKDIHGMTGADKAVLRGCRVWSIGHSRGDAIGSLLAAYGGVARAFSTLPEAIQEADRCIEQLKLQGAVAEGGYAASLSQICDVIVIESKVHMEEESCALLRSLEPYRCIFMYTNLSKGIELSGGTTVPNHPRVARRCLRSPGTQQGFLRTLIELKQQVLRSSSEDEPDIMSSPIVSGGAGAAETSPPLHSSVRGSSSAARAKLLPMSGYPLRILLAEDNLINQKMMVMLLRKMGYEILVAANGQQALEQ